MRVLLVTWSDDAHGALVEERLRLRGVPVTRFETDRFPADQRLTLFAGRNGSFVSLNKASDDIDSIPIKSVLLRPIQDSDCLEVGDRFQAFALQERSAAIAALASCLPDARWINDYYSSVSAEDKMRQLLLARKHGLAVPESLVTNDAAKAETFRKSRNCTVIKPLRERKLAHDEHGVFALGTARVIDNLAAESNSLSVCPIFLQEEIPKGFELRINVVGSDVFATAIFSQDAHLRPDVRLDYRKLHYSKLRHEAFELPGEIREKCIQITRGLALSTCAIDMIVTPELEYVFLEANPSYQWYWLEKMTGQPITEAIVNLLVASA